MKNCKWFLVHSWSVWMFPDRPYPGEPLVQHLLQATSLSADQSLQSEIIVLAIDVHCCQLAQVFLALFPEDVKGSGCSVF